LAVTGEALCAGVNTYRVAELLVDSHRHDEMWDEKKQPPMDVDDMPRLIDTTDDEGYDVLSDLHTDEEANAGTDMDNDDGSMPPLMSGTDGNTTSEEDDSDADTVHTQCIHIARARSTNKDILRVRNTALREKRQTKHLLKMSDGLDLGELNGGESDSDIPELVSSDPSSSDESSADEWDAKTLLRLEPSREQTVSVSMAKGRKSKRSADNRGTCTYHLLHSVQFTN
jgi:hypothetical protein